LSPAEETPEAVAGAVRRLLGETSFRQAAQEVAREIAAMPSPEELVVQLTELAGR
jgi:hypothetical protein